MTIRRFLPALLFACMPVAAQDSSDDIEEIQVTGRPVSDDGTGSIASRVLSREEIRRGVGTAGDIFRGLSALPGVAATGAFSSFTVRGRGPRDNLILIDGIPYDRAVHFDQALGEEEDIGGGGRFSIFGQEVVDSATYKPGGWEARYAGAGGALLKLGLAEGDPSETSVSAKVDLAGGEILYSGPAPFSDQTGLLVSARYYNFGQLFKLIGADEIGKPVLADFLVKSTTEFASGSRLDLIALYTPENYSRGLNAVLADDNLEDPLILDSEQDAGLIGTTLTTAVGQDGEWRNSVFYRWADDTSSQGEALFDPANLPADLQQIMLDEAIISLREKESEFGWRSDFSLNNAPGGLSAGMHLSRLSLNYRQTLSRDYALLEFDQNDFRPDPAQPYILLTPEAFDAVLEESAVRVAGYLDQRFDMGKISLTTGLRVDHDDLLSATTISPRFQASWMASNATRFNLTAGLYYQSPRLLDVAADQTNINLRPERTLQATMGVEHALDDIWQLTAEVYVQQLRNLVPDGDRVTGIKTNSGRGHAAGLDVAVTRLFSDRWSGTLRYGYNRTRIDDGDGNGFHAAQFNRPHLVNMTLFRELGRNWSVGIQYQIASGRPSDDFAIQPLLLPDSSLPRFSRQITARYTGRYPAWQTLNFRADYQKQFGGVLLKAFIDVINVTGRKNIDEVDFSPVTGEINRDGLGVFPQLGLSVHY